jgi:protein TonB
LPAGCFKDYYESNDWGAFRRVTDRSTERELMTSRTHDARYAQRRMVAFAAIVAVHVFIAWAFITGFGQKIVHQAQNILETTIIKQEEVEDKPPPPPKPDLERPPPPSVPVPIINVQVPIEAPAVVVTKAPPPAPKAVAIVAATPIKTVRLPSCGEDYYPAQAKRLNQTGSVIVKYCIGVNNKFDGPVEVTTSSGFPLLDEAAGKCLAAGSFKAAIGPDGKPMRSCKEIKVTFKTLE